MNKLTKMAFEKVCRKRDVMESLMKNLFHLRTQYFTDNKSIPKNVLVQLYRNIDVSLDALLGLCKFCWPRWITPRGNEELSVALMAAIDDSRIGPNEAVSFIGKVEQALFPVIDLPSLVGCYFSHDGFQFCVMVTEDFCSSCYLQTLMNYHTDYWKMLEEQIRYQSQIRVTFYDDMLSTPADCLLTAQFLIQFQERFRIKMSGIQYVSSKINKNMTTNLFPYGITWKAFLKRTLENTMYIPVSVTEGASPSFPRMLVLQNKHFRLELVHLTGLSHNLDLSVDGRALIWEEAKLQPMINMTCKLNKHQAFAGLPFLVSYMPAKAN